METGEFPEWIEPGQFAVVQHLADGGFGSVYRASWPQPCKTLADLTNHKKYPPFTVVLKTVTAGDGMVAVFLKELVAMSKRSQGLYPKFYGVTKLPRSNTYALVLEHFRGGDLRTLLEAQHSTFTWDRLLKILYQISSSLDWAHARGIVHGNLHTGNILLKGWITVISDFGLNKALHQTRQSTRGIYGVIPYMAPELLCGEPYSTEADVYAFGMIMWELSAGRPPFSDCSHVIYLMRNICDGDRPPIVASTPKCWADLMQRCWHDDPRRRPSAQAIMKKVKSWQRYNIARDWHAVAQFSGHPEGLPKNANQQRHPGAVYSSRLIPCIEIDNW